MYFTIEKDERERERLFTECLRSKSCYVDFVPNIDGAADPITTVFNPSDILFSGEGKSVSNEKEVDEWDSPIPGGGFELKYPVLVAENEVFRIVQTHRRRGRVWDRCRSTDQSEIVKEKKAPLDRNGIHQFEVRVKATEEEMDQAKMRLLPFTFIGTRADGSGNGLDIQHWVFDAYDQFEWVEEIKEDKTFYKNQRK
jgi:hypothetical protein